MRFFIEIVNALLLEKQTSIIGLKVDVWLNFGRFFRRPTALCTAAVCFILLFHPKKGVQISVKNVKLSLFPFKRAVSLILSIVISLSLVITGANRLKAFDYITYQLTPSLFIENEYVDAKEVSIEFPENKRNLIYIFMESMEASFFSKELGGGLDHNTIPELYSLAKNNINFSESEEVGGSYVVPGATWTMGALLAETAGLPLKVPANTGNDMGYRKNFFPSITTLTDILKKNGYNQSFMCGSSISFGEGDRLGLSINLFSGKETLAEKYGIKEMASELKKRSKMYDDELLRIYDDN